MVCLFSALSRHFLAAATLRSIVNQIPDLTVVAVGMTLVLIVGGIDLSVGSVLALSASVLGLALVDGDWPVPLAALVALATGAACGLASGLVTVTWSIPSFIVTLGMLEIARGAAYLVTDSQTKYVGTQLDWLARPLPALAGRISRFSDRPWRGTGGSGPALPHGARPADDRRRHERAGRLALRHRPASDPAGRLRDLRAP